MIELETRVEYVRSIAEFVLDDAKIRSVWVNGEKGITSVTDFNELYEQLFDDLDFDEVEEELPPEIVEFLGVVRDVDASIQKEAYLRYPQNLLRSDQWEVFREVCKRVLNSPAHGNPLHRQNVG